MKYSDELMSAVKAVLSSKLDISKKEYDISNYKEKRAEYYKNIIESRIKKIKEIDEDYYEILWRLYRNDRLEEMISTLEDVRRIEPEQKTKKRFIIPGLPAEIREEVNADLKEMERCLENNLLRSAIILCGRILETALHRKYYEHSGRDLLETSPGIGLGNLIAKLKELNYSFDPGLSEQVHLINQVRIYSVHKKQDAFSPTREQAEAIVLYTLDIVRKMF